MGDQISLPQKPMYSFIVKSCTRKHLKKLLICRKKLQLNLRNKRINCDISVTTTKTYDVVQCSKRKTLLDCWLKCSGTKLPEIKDINDDKKLDTNELFLKLILYHQKQRHSQNIGKNSELNVSNHFEDCGLEH
jgi:hypothetical protein